MLSSILFYLGLSAGIALLAAGAAIGTWKWRTDRAQRLLTEELGDETIQVLLPAIIGDGMRVGTGAVALLADRLELRSPAFGARTIPLRDVRKISPSLSMRRLVRYEKAAPTFSIQLRDRETVDLVIQSSDRGALTRFKDALEGR